MTRAEKTLENYPTLTLNEIDLIIGAVNRDGKKMSNGAIASRNNYRLIRASYATVLLALADLTGEGDKLRKSAIEKLQVPKTEDLNMVVTLTLDEERTGEFIDELESLLSKFAEPRHKYYFKF